MSNALAHLSTDSSDDDIGDAIVENILRADNPGGPFRLGYEFAGHAGPPPVKGHDVVLNRTLCVVEITDRQWAAQWIRDCLAAGLRVQRFVGHGWRTPITGNSIRDARSTLEARERMNRFDERRVQMPLAPEDEIPF